MVISTTQSQRGRTCDMYQVSYQLAQVNHAAVLGRVHILVLIVPRLCMFVRKNVPAYRKIEYYLSLQLQIEHAVCIYTQKPPIGNSVHH